MLGKVLALLQTGGSENTIVEFVKVRRLSVVAVMTNVHPGEFVGANVRTIVENGRVIRIGTCGEHFYNEPPVEVAK